MAKQRADLFKRKNQNCTSFYYILCGDALKRVEDFREKYYEKTQSPIGYKAAVNLMLLEK